jgi:hypothetical protein
LLSTEKDSRAVSVPDSTPKDPPTNSIASLICGAVRVVVPWLSMIAVRFATPGLAGGSKTAPAWSVSVATTMGTADRSATRRTIPEGSTSRCVRDVAWLGWLSQKSTSLIASRRITALTCLNPLRVR